MKLREFKDLFLQGIFVGGESWDFGREIVQMHKNYVNYTLRAAAAEQHESERAMKPLSRAAERRSARRGKKDDDMNYSILSENVYLKFIKLWDLHT